MAQNGFLEIEPEQSTAGDVLTSLNREGKLICLAPNHTLQQAAEAFRRHGFSQMPVVEGGKMVGAIQEIMIVHALHGRVSSNVPIREIMARALPQVEVTVPLQEVYRLLLAGNPAVVIAKGGRMNGLITRSDLMDFYERSAKAEGI